MSFGSPHEGCNCVSDFKITGLTHLDYLINDRGMPVREACLRVWGPSPAVEVAQAWGAVADAVNEALDRIERTPVERTAA